MPQTSHGNSDDTSPIGPELDPWFTPGRFGIFLGLAITAVFPNVVFGLHTFFYRDFGVLAYPMVHYHHESFWRGELPLWNPLSNCGAPFLAQWGTMALYPLSLFYLLLPLPWSLNFFCLAHLFGAGLGMYFLALRWTENRFAASVAATAFVFNGLTFSCLIWPNYTVALGWMPWIVLSVEQAWKEGGRKLVAAAVIAAMQMLSGVPEIVGLTWLLLLGIWIQALCARTTPLRLHTGRVLAVILLASGLAAAQLWPFFDLLGHSQRGSDFATAKWAMPIWGWANLLVPLFRCFLTPQGVFFQIGQEFMSSTYLGVAVLTLGLFAIWTVREWRVWLLAGLAGFSLVMALGESGFVYRWVKHALPLLGFARYPIKFAVLAAFVFPLLTAYAVRNIHSFSPISSEPRWRQLLSLWIATVLAIGVLLWLSRQYPTVYDQWSAIWRCGFWRAVFLSAAVALLGVRTWTQRFALRRVTEVGLLVLLILDTLTHVPNQNPSLPAHALAPGLWEIHNKTSPPIHGQGRVLISPRAEQHLLLSRVPDLYSDFLGKRLALWSNLNLLEGAPKVNGSSTLQIREQMEVQTLLYASTNTDLPHLADFLAVSQVTTPGEIVEWTKRDSDLPLVTGGQRPIFADRTETLSGLTNANFNPKEFVYLPLEAEPFVTATNRMDVTIATTRFTSQNVEIAVSAKQPSLLVIAQTHYPPWHAYVDGARASLWRANHAFQALQVPAGNHQVKVVYEDRSFAYGAAISATTLSLCVGLWLRDRRLKIGPVPYPSGS